MAEKEKQLKLIEQAYESNERLIHVVNDLLNVSRIEDGNLPYNPQLTDLRAMLNDIKVTSEKTCLAKKLHLECVIPEKLSLVELDPLLFKQVLQNLMDNAIDYNIENGWVKIEVFEVGGEIQLEISNSSEGISKEDLKKIFDQFYRSPEAIRIQPNGNGLGLYLTRAIMRQHGSDVLCESDQETKVTKFTIRLKLPNV